MAQRKSSVGSTQEVSIQTSPDVTDSGEEGEVVDILTPEGWKEIHSTHILGRPIERKDVAIQSGESTQTSAVQTSPPTSSLVTTLVKLVKLAGTAEQVEEEQEVSSGEVKNLVKTQDVETQTVSSPSSPSSPSTPNSSFSQPQTPPRTLAESIVRNNQGYGPWRSKQSHSYSLDCYEKIWNY